jgi:hypothetical protein
MSQFEQILELEFENWPFGQAVTQAEFDKNIVETQEVQLVDKAPLHVAHEELHS